MSLCVAALLLVASCSGIADDLAPSGADRRAQTSADTVGPSVGQRAPEFAVMNTEGNVVTLASALGTGRAVVLYFTMWCPVCDSHMSHMLSTVIPQHGDVKFYAVDYVSDSPEAARGEAVANGYSATAFGVLADVEHALLNNFGATMGTTVVIDRAGVVRMNEDYKDGSRLQTLLESIP